MRLLLKAGWPIKSLGLLSNSLKLLIDIECDESKPIINSCCYCWPLGIWQDNVYQAIQV